MCAHRSLTSYRSRLSLHVGRLSKLRALKCYCSRTLLQETLRVRTACLLASSVLGAICIPCVSAAQVQLPTVDLGLSNFEDGLAGPGLLLEVFPDYNDANTLKDSYGNTVPGRNHLTAYSTTTHVAYVSQQGLLGGQLTAEAFLTWVDVDVHANGASSKVNGFVDPNVAVGVQWLPKKIGDGVFAGRLMLLASVPAASYDNGKPVTLSNNFVAIDPYYALTYELPKIEFSARLYYLWNSVNHEPFTGLGADAVQAGQAFHMNYSASYEVVRNVRVGFSGYWLQQTTDDKINGVNVQRSLERTVGLGAGIQYFAGNDTWIHLNAFQETDVRNRTQGPSVVLRFSKVIPQ
jgi:hypothetical protein